MHALICLLIKNSSAKGDIVVDGFGGSGSVMVACEQMGRNARMVEKLGIKELPALLELKKGEIVRGLKPQDLNAVKEFVK